jgi:uncharacterized protein YoxC
MPDLIIAFVVRYYPIKNPLWQKITDLSKHIFSLVHGSKQAKNNQANSNRHRRKTISNASQSRISKNFTYSKRDVNDFGY